MNFKCRVMTMILASSLLMPLLGGFAIAQDGYPKIIVNEKAISENEVLNKNGCIYISPKALESSFDAEVVFNDKFLMISDANNSWLFYPNSNEYIFNNETRTLANSTVSENNVIYMPLEEISELLGGEASKGDNQLNIKYTKKEKDLGNGKKVYALYHTLRGARENDGMNLNWDAFYDTSKSATGREYSIYNSDLVDENGRHQVASINDGPLVGKGSDLDSDYLEYEVLLGKAGGIDGFALDFAFIEHTGTEMQAEMIKQSEKYGFEVSIDYTDSSAVNTTWIENYRNDIIGRDARVEYVKDGMQYILSNVYSSKAGANIDGHPIIFFFGGGLKPEEYVDLLSYDFTLPDSDKEMYIVRRYPFSGTYTNGNMEFKDSSVWNQWVDIGIDAHTWCPDRLRPMDKDNLDFDTYASMEDMKKYQEEALEFWKAGKKAHVNVACATPGFDNRGCGAWGGGSFRGYDRYDGEMYRMQWNYFNENKDYIDVVFIGSWNDFTEGHEIQPSVKNGYREIETTQEYSLKLKDKEYSDDKKEILILPQKIYDLRKKSEKYEQIGFDITECSTYIDAAAMAVSRNEFVIANKMIDSAYLLLDEFNKDVEVSTIKLSQNDNSLFVTQGEKIITEDSLGVAIDDFKAVSANDEKNGAALRAVDKMLKRDSCWSTGSDKETYYLDMEFKYPYDFTGVGLYLGNDEGKNIIKNGELQYFEDGEWKTVPNTGLEENSDSYRCIKFSNPICTDRLRLVSYDSRKPCVVREIVPYATKESVIRTDKLIFDNTPIKYKKGKNVALGSNVLANGENSGYPAKNLIDGVTTDDSRWIYTSSNDIYWAEIEFDREYSICGADAYTGKTDGSWAVSDFYMEYEKNGEWIKIPGAEASKNTAANVSLTFQAPVLASKVRFVSTDGANGCRMRELAIYENAGVEEAPKSLLSIRGEEIASKATVISNDGIDGYPIQNINDKNITDNSMWMSGTNSREYTVEFDFKQKQEIVGNDIYSGYSDGAWAIENVRVQYFTGDKWVDVKGGAKSQNPKSNTDLSWNFDEIVKADKIRYVFPEGSRGVKIRDIFIYSKVIGESIPSINTKNNAYISIDDKVRDILNNNYFEGTMSYDLISTDKGAMTIKGCSNREPKKVGVNYGDFSIIARLENVKTLGVSRQRVELYKKNICFDKRYNNSSDIVIYGVNSIDNIEMEFSVYKKIR